MLRSGGVVWRFEFVQTVNTEAACVEADKYAVAYCR